MFNFRRLADAVECQDKEDGLEENRIEYANSSRKSSNEAMDLEHSTATLKADTKAASREDQAQTEVRLEVKTDTPGLMVTPVTPTAGPGDKDGGKQLGH